LQEKLNYFLIKKRSETKMKYVCEVCGYEYDETAGDPENGIDPGTTWDELPEDFVCPICGAEKEEFTIAD